MAIQECSRCRMSEKFLCRSPLLLVILNLGNLDTALEGSASELFESADSTPIASFGSSIVTFLRVTCARVNELVV